MSVLQDPDSVLGLKVNFAYTREVTGGAASVNVFSARRNGALGCLHNGGDDLIKVRGVNCFSMFRVSEILSGKVSNTGAEKTQYDSLEFRRLAGEAQWVVEFPLPAKV